MWPWAQSLPCCSENPFLSMVSTNTIFSDNMGPIHFIIHSSNVHLRGYFIPSYGGLTTLMLRVPAHGSSCCASVCHCPGWVKKKNNTRFKVTSKEDVKLDKGKESRSLPKSWINVGINISVKAENLRQSQLKWRANIYYLKYKWKAWYQQTHTWFRTLLS